ncbi:hypothetical protein D3C75_1066090 [compost metagenome]
MVDELVGTRDVFRRYFADSFAGVTVRRDHRPAVLVHKHLMYAKLMSFAPVREPGMEEVERLPAVFIVIYRIMAG